MKNKVTLILAVLILFSCQKPTYSKKEYHVFKYKYIARENGINLYVYIEGYDKRFENLKKDSLIEVFDSIKIPTRAYTYVPRASFSTNKDTIMIIEFIVNAKIDSVKKIPYTPSIKEFYWK